MEKFIGKYKINVDYDTDPYSPREDSNLGKMICFHGRYNLGDKNYYNHVDYSSWEEMKETIMKHEKVIEILPLFLYDHSGITISTSPFSCNWDSGQIGFIYATEETLEETGVKREHVNEVLKMEVSIYDRYLRGNVWRYEIYEIHKCDLGHEHETFVTSCGGFYDEDDCIAQAEAEVDYK